jgi:peptidoglycan/LPS O-acetylase OafA/YrhL
VSDPRQQSRRVPALDGLRGIAALVVVVHHTMVTSAPLAAPYVGHDPHPLWAEIMTFTPLHLLWADPAGVMLFFLLSGFVLTMPALTGCTRWLSFYPKRLIRLYVPIVGAVAFTVLTVLLAPRTTWPGQSWWVAEHDVPLTLGTLARDVVVVTGPTWLNVPLWSQRQAA